MSVRPARLNAVVGWLFITGSACFVVGSVPAYANAVGGPVDGVTYFAGSIFFFTTASFAQLVQAQSPAITGVDQGQQDTHAPVRFWNWLPPDRKLARRGHAVPGTVFFNVSTLAALAHNATMAGTDRRVWRPDLFGSTLVLVSSAFAILAASDHVLSVQTRSVPCGVSHG
jgi:hypothetical protein